MQHETAEIFKLASKGRQVLLGLSLLFVFSMQVGCAEVEIYDPPLKEPAARFYFYPYEEVWRAIQLAVRRYQIPVNNFDSGILETKFVRGDKIFSNPTGSKSGSGVRYKLIIRAVKGRFEGKKATKVTILKQSERQPDFFSGYQTVPSNGLEERALLYRIGRYLEIEELVKEKS